VPAREVQKLRPQTPPAAMTAVRCGSTLIARGTGDGWLPPLHTRFASKVAPDDPAATDLKAELRVTSPQRSKGSGVARSGAIRRDTQKLNGCVARRTPRKVARMRMGRGAASAHRARQRQPPLAALRASDAQFGLQICRCGIIPPGFGSLSRTAYPVPDNFDRFVGVSGCLTHRPGQGLTGIRGGWRTRRGSISAIRTTFGDRRPSIWANFIWH